MTPIRCQSVSVPRDFAHSALALAERRDRVLGYVHSRNMASPYPWYLRAQTWLRTKRTSARHILIGLVAALTVVFALGMALWANGYLAGVNDTRVAMSGAKGGRK